MKIISKRFLTLFAVLFAVGNCFAAPPEPVPNTPPPPPGFPIDGDLMLLLYAALLYGCYKVYQFTANKKAPM